MDSPEQERIAHLVRLLERQFRRSLERRLEKHDVRFGHWEFLRILWHEEGLSQRELAVRSGLTGPTVHTAMNKMEAKGLIVRVVPEGARSRPVIHLSARGRKLEKLLVPQAIESNEVAVNGMTAKEIKASRTLLLKMIHNLSADQ